MTNLFFYYYVIIIILLVIIICRLFFSENNHEVNDKIININELKTGDLLFIRYNNSLGYFMRLWSMCPWTHIAMVYRSPNNKLYIMETANYQNKKGVLFLEMKDWLKLNKKCSISVMQLQTPENYNRDILLENFKKLTDKKLDTFNINWFRLLYIQKYSSIKNQENITCYELIVYLLQESNIAKKKLSPSSYFPRDIIERKLPLFKNFYYSKLYKFISN